MKKIILSFTLLCMVVATSFAQTATISVLTPPCHSDGVVVVTVSGITPPLRYTYYFGTYGYFTPVTHGPESSVTDTLRGWMGGMLNVSVIDSSYSASAYATYLGGPFNMTLTAHDTICPVLGTVTASVTGGTGTYTYQWYNSTGASVGTTNPLSTTPGYYYVVVTDAAGCTMDSRTDGDTSGGFLGNRPPFTFSVSETDASCTNGTASITGLTGGTTPYTYLWSNGATTTSLTGLTMGDYSVVVTDASGCSSDPVYTYVNQSPVITVNTTVTPASCLDTDGAVIAFGTGGVSPYTYNWSTGATTASISHLPAGYYPVTATDANGCIGNGYGYISVSSPITVTYTTTASSCTAPTGSATLTLAGGTSPYTVTWYTSPPQTGITATSLAPGIYSFRVVDAVGCVQTGSVYIPPVDVMSASYTITDAACTSATGGVTMMPSGGVRPYTYSWSTGATDSAITGVASNTYEVTITDANGCSIVKYPEVFSSSPVRLGFTSTEASCLYTSDGSITVVPTGGTAPYTYLWSTGATTATVSGLPTNLYCVSVIDHMGCTASDTTTLGYDTRADFCYCTISGTVYNDRNGNCTQDAGEPGINNIQLHCSGMGYTYTDTSGHYSFKVPTGSYIVSQRILAYYPLSTCQSNSISVSAVASSGCVHTVNFADTLNPIHDVHICTWDYYRPIPGNTYTQTAIVSNQSTITEPAILAGYKADGQLYDATFTPSGIFGAGGGYYYFTSGTFPSLDAGASQQLFMNYNVPTDIPIGTNVVFKDSVAYASPMSNWLSDYSPWNNVNYFTTPVVGSFDPNFVEVSPKGYGAPGYITTSDSVLEYMVHFQNTGTWYAQNIVVIDTLDPNLDWTSMSPEFQSQKCLVTVSETGVAKFTFANINLPTQSMNDFRSNAMFTYTIHTRSGMPMGTTFKCKAGIYFDYNAPVYTNTTLNTLGWPESVPNVPASTNGNTFSVYPNPANNSFNVVISSDLNEDYNLRVSDITGKNMIVKPIYLQKGIQTISVDASKLSSGVYFVTISGTDKLQTQKVVIIK